jgi:pyruvate/2-oxoglutarate dehydrogenase complex dihydrolipoamide acyltransferase (E2) component
VPDPRWSTTTSSLAPTLVLSLTVDHQVTDGAPATAFLADVADLLTHPDRLD